MADNFPLTPGTGRNAATKEVTHSGDTADVQLVQLVGVSGAEGSRSVVEEPFIGFVGSKQKTVTVSKTRPSNTTTYAAGDVLAETSQTIWTFDAIARAADGSGVIVGAVLMDDANQTLKGQFELWLFDVAPSTPADNAAFAPTDAEADDVIGIIPFNNFYIGNTGSGGSGNVIYPVQGLSIPFNALSGTDDLAGILVVRNAYVPISGGIFKIKLQVIQH